jgi:hypothetical protein
LGLEPVKVGLNWGEEIVQVRRLVTLGEGLGQGLGQGEGLGDDNESQMKESFEVVMSLIGDRGKGKEQSLGDRLQMGATEDGIRESLQGIYEKGEHH